MKKIIHYNPNEAGKLHCDDCGYDLPELQPFVHELVGTTCPKCGANMLTEEDFQATKRMMNGVDLVNKFFAFFGVGSESPEPGDQAVSVRYHAGEIHTKFRKDV